ncbi:hypothetical protein P7C73_g3869, partial [Tremellales sp. Uapishka_1]
MNPMPIIASSNYDLERRRLESTIDQDLHSLSLGSLVTTTNSASDSHSFISSVPSIEYPRGLHDPLDTLDTPRAARRTSTVAEQSLFVGASPASTAGHHASAMTLGAGVFKTKKHSKRESENEFDPERSLGRLVGELGRVMGSERRSPRPTSPFAPRSPSPLPTNQQDFNLTLTLNQNDPLPSPPSSGSGSRSQSRFASIVPPPRRALSDSTADNIPSAPSAKQRDIKRVQAEDRRPSPMKMNNSADITGMTGLMETPAKGEKYGTLGKNGDVGGDHGANIAQTLATLHARLRALETENSVSRRRVRELEAEVERARGEVEEAKRSGDGRLRQAIGEKSALEDLVKSLRVNLTRLTIELEQNKALVSELRMAARSPNVSSEISELRREVERLSKEVERLGNVVEGGLEERRKARGERTIQMEKEEMERIQREMEKEREQEKEVELERVRRDVERRKSMLGQQQPLPQGPSILRQGLHMAAVSQPQLAPPSVAPPTRIQSNPPQAQDPQSHPIHRKPQTTQPDHTLPPSPAPSDLSSPTPTSRSSSSRRKASKSKVAGSPFPSIDNEQSERSFFNATSPWSKQFEAKTIADIVSEKAGDIPPQTVLARVVRELETDFKHYKSIYAELADQYKILDAASAIAKRHVLAEHLKEVIDTLEQKADQISSLYDLLDFKDRPVSPSHPEDLPPHAKKSVNDLMRLVRESLGEDALRRLEEDIGIKVGRRLHRSL